ncbi:MAG TPA: ABC transporter permease [Candidatus Paceibacterota bacterium]|nr:ABC transporter permease [Candidatus Paceibacterota bacterium]
MKTRDILQETLSALKSNKIRTGLTMLGIVIGIASVIAMTAIGQGAQNSISSSIESMGANLIIVMPGAQRTFGGGPTASRGGAQSLTLEDAEAIESQVKNISAVVREVSSQKQVVAPGTNTNTSITGTESSYAVVKNIEMAEGTFITDQQVSKTSKVAVLGSTTRDDLFGEGATDIVGEKIRISGTEYTVVGVAEEKGGSGMTNSDDIIYIPYTTAQRYLSGNKYLSRIEISASSSEVSTVVQEDVTALLLAKHNKTSEDADFNTLNQSDILETASDVAGTFTTLLAAIAAISLLVGGIGIMNMMLTTVTERTKEIGLRKAIGAKKRDINLQFLTEATLLTFMGGVIGVILGWVISFAVDYFGITETAVSLSSILLAFGVSAFIGIVFGYYPAQRASKLNPIEALRYE